MLIKTQSQIKKTNKRELINLGLFSLGQFVSLFGTSVYKFAIGLYVLKLTGSGLSFAATIVFGMVAAIIFNPIAGVIADRFDKKKVVVIMDMLNGMLFIAMFFISLIYELNLTIIYLSSFFTTVFTTIFGISLEASKPNIVSDKKLMNINSISKIIDSASAISGPMIGGLIFAFMNMKIFILVNGISFILSGISEGFINFKFNKKEEIKQEGEKNFVKEMKEGFKYIKGRKDIIGIGCILVSLNFFTSISVSVPLPFIINNVLHLSSRYYGIIESFFPIGMIAGALGVKKIMRRVPYKILLIRMSIILSGSMVLIGIPLMIKNVNIDSLGYLIYYSIITFIFGVAIALIDIPIMYILQKTISEEIRGRVLSISFSFVKVIAPIGLIIAGVLTNRIPAYILPIVGGSSLLIINMITLKSNNAMILEEVE